jgi:hypothetical protein
MITIVKVKTYFTFFFNIVVAVTYSALQYGVVHRRNTSAVFSVHVAVEGGKVELLRLLIFNGVPYGIVRAL